ncbi:MAG TPA: cytochrome P450 [Acidimicrobiales bacterium]|nr:cytochrome P450 [Acidimicrobiales bacterium]
MDGREPGGPALRLGTPGFFLRPDYYDVLARLRRDAPVQPTVDGMVALSRYEDVRAVSRDPTRFVSGRGVLVNDPLRDPEGTGQRAFSILHLDPPMHAAYRSVVNRQFTPRALAPLEARIRTVVQVALDAVPADEPVDLVEALAAPIPIAVIAEMLGVVGADRAQLRRWSDAAIESTDSTSAEQAEQLGQLAGFLMGHVRSPHTDRVDLLGLLKTTPVSDRLLDEAEIMGFCLTLLVAGNETTRTLISGGAEALARHPEQRAALASDAALVPGAVEEMLRWVTPIQAFGRTAAIDTEIAGCEVPAGTFVVMLYASANRDESVFGATSDQFDVGRPVHPTHLAFGFGEHSCLGASLARLESRIFFEELLARYPRYRIHGEPSYTASTLVNGARSMPVLLTG